MQCASCCDGPVRIPHARACGIRPSGWSMPIGIGSPAMLRSGRVPAAHLRRSRGLRRDGRVARHRLRVLCEHHMAPIIGRAHVGYLPTTAWSASASWRVWSTAMRVASRCRKSSPRKSPHHPRGAQAAWRRCGGRRRAPMHDHARRPQARRVDGDQQDARHLPRGRRTRAEFLRFIGIEGAGSSGR